MSERPDEAAERQQRFDALRSLAHDTPATPAAPTPATPSQPEPAAPRRRPSAPRGRWRRWQALGLVIVVVALVVGVVVGAILRNSGPQPGAHSAPAAKLIAATYAIGDSAGVYCPSTPVWSPDSKQFVVVGQTNQPTAPCVTYDPQVALAQVDASAAPPSVSEPFNSYELAIFDAARFDAASGRLIRRIPIASVSDTLLCKGTSEPKFCFAIFNVSEAIGWHPDAAPSWSPNGQSVAVFFTYGLLTGFTPQDVQQCAGLYLFNATGGGAPRLLTACTPPTATASHDLSVVAQASARRFTWNLATGAASSAAIPDAPSAAQLLDTMPFASAYAIDADGAVVVAHTLASPEVTPWRSGSVAARGSAHDLALYRASQWVWSRDGRFVTPNLDTSTYLRLPGVHQSAPTSARYQPPVTPAPDRALAAVVTAAGSSPAGLAYSPDGKWLASFACAPNGAGQLTLRSVATGQTLTQASHTYPLTSASLGCAGSLSPIAWSPDGAHIATTDGPDAQMLIWQVKLPG